MNKNSTIGGNGINEKLHSFADEVLLFEGSCYLHDENRKLYNAMTVSMDTRCLLTNLSLVFVSTIKRAFQKPEIKVKKFPFQ